MSEEIVMAVFANGTTGLRKKTWCQRTGTSYRLLEHQPLTPKEKRALERQNEEDRQAIEDREALAAMVRRGVFREKERSQNRGIGGGKVHLSAAERESLSRFIGAPVEDAQHARRLMKEKGMRFLERGERSEEIIDATIDYAESGGEQRGEAFREEFQLRNDELGFVAPAKRFDFAERLKYHRERLGERA